MIKAKVILQSAWGAQKVTTFELEYPRFIHAELMTHRVFSRNAASSRAIPITEMIRLAEEHTAIPIWTKNQAGMQGKVAEDIDTIQHATEIWEDAMIHTIKKVQELDAIGIHKQNANRLLEPFQHIKTIVTTTDLSNWNNLRMHPDAQPEIQALATAMFLAEIQCDTQELSAGEWHLPYTTEADGTPATRKMISASCCAQVSYRKNDDSFEKAEKIYDMLISAEVLHASPFEHQCTGLIPGQEQRGNLIGFKQLRQEIELRA